MIESPWRESEKDFELVFVGENSTELLSKVKQYSEGELLHSQFKMREGAYGFAQVRNLRMSISNVEIVAILDDDTVAPINWVGSAIDGFADSDVVGINGSVYPLWTGPCMSWLPKEFYWLISCVGWFNPWDSRNT